MVELVGEEGLRQGREFAGNWARVNEDDVRGPTGTHVGAGAFGSGQAGADDGKSFHAAHRLMWATRPDTMELSNIVLSLRWCCRQRW